jgi:hypothetical protein
MGTRIQGLKSVRAKIYFRIIAQFSKSFLSADFENKKVHNEAGQNMKPEGIRYIIFGTKIPDIEFVELKELCRNVRRFHVKKFFYNGCYKHGNGGIIEMRKLCASSRLFPTYD